MPTDQFVIRPQGSTVDAASSAAGIAAGLLFRAVLYGAAGYFVGQKTGQPAATAVASGLFGLPGMLVATVYAVRENGR